jgi:sugar phosphate isomerase/epimerase
MIAEFTERPAEFAHELKKRDLSLAAFAYSSPGGFTDAVSWDADLEGARQAITFLHEFPESCLALGGACHPSRADASQKLDQAIHFYNTVGQLAAPLGISVNVHPHSHHGSLLESAAEYQYLLDHLDPALVSLGPDTGHIVRSGQELLVCLRTHIGRITHLHLKDVSTSLEWVGLGEGICDFPSVKALLDAAGYQGWVVAEEESEAARQDGIAAIQKNPAYLHSIGY